MEPLQGWRAFINVEEHNLHKINLKWRSAFYFISLFCHLQVVKSKEDNEATISNEFR